MMPGDGSITIQDSRAPLYVVTFAGKVSDEEFRGYLSALSALLKRSGSRAFVFDARLALPSPASQRRMQAEWMKLNDAETRKNTRGIAFIVASPLVRGALTAILWVQPLPCPHLVTSNFDEGFHWASQALSSRLPLRPA